MEQNNWIEGFKKKYWDDKHSCFRFGVDFDEMMSDFASREQAIREEYEGKIAEAYDNGKGSIIMNTRGMIDLTAETKEAIKQQARTEALEEVLELVSKHDPQSGKSKSKIYWGNTLREAIQKLKQ